MSFVRTIWELYKERIKSAYDELLGFPSDYDRNLDSIRSDG